MQTFMKIITLVVLLGMTTTTSAQGTTEEEYNFMTKGYAIQLASGLDMKKGYTLKDMGNWPRDYGSNVQRVTSFKGLFRDGSTIPCAILMIYKRTDSSSAPKYYCIPTLDAEPEIWANTHRAISAATEEIGSGEMAAAMIWGLMHLGVQEATK